MKKHTLYIAALCLLLAASCTKDFEELRENPNVVLEVEPDQLFAEGVRAYQTSYVSRAITEIWGINTWMQVQADINGISAAGDEYAFDAQSADGVWGLIYNESLGNVAEAMRLTEDDPAYTNRHAMYKIYRAYLFQRATDLWGDIPYNEAHDLINEENNPNYSPAYDKQDAIYDALISDVQMAVAALDPAGDSMGMQDWLYQGDVNAWKRLGNSLLLRMAMRISNKDVAKAQEIVVDFDLNSDLIASNAQSATFPHGGTLRLQNNFYTMHNEGDGMRHPSKFLVDKLNGDADPRIARFAEFTEQSIIFQTFEYIGVPSFVPAFEVDANEQNNFTRSYVGDYFLEANREGILMSHAEVCFLMAEAALNGWVSGTAEDYFTQGIRAHMEQLAVEESEIETYLQSAGVFDGTQEHIINEKWKTFVYTDPLELFAEWRRTGFPVLTDNDGQEISTTDVPVRWPYPFSEVNLNQSNVQAVGEGINDFSSPIWWDEM